MSLAHADFSIIHLGGFSKNSPNIQLMQFLLHKWSIPSTILLRLVFSCFHGQKMIYIFEKIVASALKSCIKKFKRIVVSIFYREKTTFFRARILLICNLFPPKVHLRFLVCSKWFPFYWVRMIYADSTNFWILLS